MNWIDPHDDWDDDECVKAGCLHIMGIVLAIIVGILACSILGSCTTTKYVPVIEHKIDTVWQNHTSHDSIYLHDSTYVFVKGDTLYMERWHTKYVEREVHDTLYQAVHDSIPQPYPVIKEVPAELTWWQHFRISLANILLWVVGIVAVVTLVRWWLKQKKVI
jgi:hypothetical protein